MSTNVAQETDSVKLKPCRYCQQQPELYMTILESINQTIYRYQCPCGHKTSEGMVIDSVRDLWNEQNAVSCEEVKRMVADA